MELVFMFGSLCTASSLCFQLVGMQICYGIAKKGSTGDMSPFTFISYFVACAVWLKYGLLQNLPVVIAVNANGSVLNFIYTIVFYRYSTKKSLFHRFLFIGAMMLVSPLLYKIASKSIANRMKKVLDDIINKDQTGFIKGRYIGENSLFHRFLFIGAMMLVSPLLYIKYYQDSHQVALEHLGSYGVFLTVISYGAPLVSLVDVIRSRSTESLSFTLIVANFLVAILWAIYGGLINDKYVQAPNILGAILALLQLLLFVIYPSSAQPKSIGIKTD